MKFERIRKLYKFRELLFMLTIRDFKLRYKQTVMGVLWALLMPVAVVAAGMIIRLVAQSAEIKGFEISSIIVKSLPWAFFISALRFSTNSLLGNSNLVAKVAFPKEVFPLAAIAVRPHRLRDLAGCRHHCAAAAGPSFSATTPIAFALLLPIIALVTGLACCCLRSTCSFAT